MTGWILQWCSAVRYGSRTGPGAADLLQQFAQRQQRLISQSCFSLLLLLLTAFLALAAGQLLSMLTRKAGFLELGTALPFIVPPAITLLLLVGFQTRQIGHQYIPHLMCGGCALFFAYLAWRCHVRVDINVQATLQHDLPDVWALVASDAGARSHLEEWLRAEFSRKFIWNNLLFEVLVIDSLWLVAFPAWALFVPFLPAASHLLLCLLSPQVSFVIEPLCGAAFIGVFLVWSSLKGMHLFFHEFVLDHRLQAALEGEAHGLRLANEARAAQRTAAQKADCMINHILKNLMADAAGCVELFQADGVPEHLQRAQECLTRGMGWCKKRQALVRLTLGQYTPLPLPTHLQRFCEAVVCQRNVALHCPAACVRLDPVLCDLVCDNALSNAFRHGHPEDPQVSLAALLEPAELGSARCRLSFVIRNRTNPARPPIPPDFLEMFRRGCGGGRPYEGMPALSDRIGLEHIYTAAQAQHMVVSLEQDGEVVTFTATMEVDPAPGPAEGLAVRHAGTLGLHPGLRFACIDDSEVACRLLAYNLHLHGKAAAVHVFGLRAGDVDAFLRFAAAPGAVDVLVLDQNLEYPQATFLGTDIARQLLAAGFTGLVCLRTASAEEGDQDLYRSSGIHCVIGKDVTGAAMVAQMMAAYSQHIALRPSALGSGSLDRDMSWGDSGSGPMSPFLCRSTAFGLTEHSPLPGFVGSF